MPKQKHLVTLYRVCTVQRQNQELEVLHFDTEKSVSLITSLHIEQQDYLYSKSVFKRCKFHKNQFLVNFNILIIISLKFHQFPGPLFLYFCCCSCCCLCDIFSLIESCHASTSCSIVSQVGLFYSCLKQCCGSGSGIRCLFDPWIRDPGWVRNQDPDPG